MPTSLARKVEDSQNGRVKGRRPGRSGRVAAMGFMAGNWVAPAQSGTVVGKCVRRLSLPTLIGVEATVELVAIVDFSLITLTLTTLNFVYQFRTTKLP